MLKDAFTRLALLTTLNDENSKSKEDKLCTLHAESLMLTRLVKKGIFHILKTCANVKYVDIDADEVSGELNNKYVEINNLDDTSKITTTTTTTTISLSNSKKHILRASCFVVPISNLQRKENTSNISAKLITNH